MWDIDIVDPATDGWYAYAWRFWQNVPRRPPLPCIGFQLYIRTESILENIITKSDYYYITRILVDD